MSKDEIQVEYKGVTAKVNVIDQNFGILGYDICPEIKVRLESNVFNCESEVIDDLRDAETIKNLYIIWFKEAVNKIKL